MESYQPPTSRGEVGTSLSGASCFSCFLCHRNMTTCYNFFSQTHYHITTLKCTPVQPLRLCTNRTAHRGSRSVALPFHDHGKRRWRGVSVTPRPLFTPRERPGTHCTGAWVGPRAGLDRCGKSRLHRDSIPGPSSP